MDQENASAVVGSLAGLAVWKTKNNLMFYPPDFSPISRVDNSSFDPEDHHHQDEADLK